MRFNVRPPAEGVVRVLHDVTVQRIGDDEWNAISREAGVVGESLVLDLGDAEAPLRYPVRVMESRPVVIEGSVRHQLRVRAEAVEVATL